jgi:hypothetical protein
MGGDQRHSTGLDEANAALARGNLLLAFDVANTAIAAGNAHPRLRYVQVLALARMGELDRAQALYDAHLKSERDVDAQALGARLLKDRAWQAEPAGQADLLVQASRAYERVFRDTGDAFPGINAASLAVLAGLDRHGRALAEDVLGALGGAATNYFDAATEAEARLLLGDEAGAEQAIARAVALPGCDPGARSSTSRQLARLVAATGRGAPLLARLRPPPVLTFCGHMFAADPATEAEVGDAIAAFLDARDIQVGYGALACGADILTAEALLARGGELNVVLPYLAEDFVETSVRPGGDAWIARFDACLARASEVVIASQTHAIGDEWQFRYGSLMTMGYARLRAEHLATDALQLALWDGVAASGQAGTAADVQLWAEHGGATHILPFERAHRPRLRSTASFPTSPAARSVRGLIFADFAGFSRIDEARLPAFWEHVLGSAARLIDAHQADVCSRNTWGDALYVVTRSARAAADVALDLQATLAGSGLDQFGQGAGMRISAHLGAVYEAVDPVTRTPTFFGREVNRAARIEPIASVGEVYVTQAFGAILQMEAPACYDLSYVGRVPLAKGFGEEPMYRLTRTGC